MSIETRIICDTCTDALREERTKVTVFDYDGVPGDDREFDVHSGACLDRLLARPEVERSNGYRAQTTRKAA